MPLMKNILDKMGDLRSVENCVTCGKKIDFLTKRYFFCSDCFLKLPKEIIVKLKQAKKNDNKIEINRLLEKSVELLKPSSTFLKLKGNNRNINELDNPKRCIICDKRVYSFCFCVDCWGLLPKNLRRSLKRKGKDSKLEGVKRLTMECCNLLKISSELKSIKNCLICDKKLGFFNSDVIPNGICLKCQTKQPEKWQKELSQVKKDKRHDQIKILIDSAVQRDFDYEIEDLLIPSHGAFKYKGGHPDFFDFAEVSLTDKPNGIVAFDNDTKEIFFTINWDSITSISADKEVIAKSSAGLSAVGLLGGRPDLTIMGAAWKNNKENNFLNIGYRHSGMETIISFEGKKAYEAAAYYISQASKYRGETTEDNGDGDKMKQVSSDPIDQIKKLAELKDAGILTEEEFLSKKKELLSAI